MSDWIVLVDGATVASSPTTYFTLKYKYGRDGANMKYTIYAYATLSSSSSYRCDSAGLQIKLDGTQVLNNTTWKPSKSGSTRSGTGWPVTYENTFTVNNKTSGTTELYVKFWDSQGAADYKKEYTKNLKVSPAGPILVSSGVSSTVNSFSFTATNSITGNMSKYQIGKVDGSWTSSEISLSNVTTFNINTKNISGFGNLTPNTNYSGIYRIRAYANDCWGDWLTLTDANFKTKSLPSSTISATNFVLKNSTPRVSISSFDNITNWTYSLKYGSEVLKSGTSTSATYQDITIDDTLANTIAGKNTSGTGRTVSCSVVVTCTGNGVSYTITTHTISFSITNTYFSPTAPSFSEIIDTNATTVGITGSNTKFISGHNNMSITITGASFKGGTSLKSYNLSCGNLSTSGTGTTYSFTNVTDSTVGVTVVDQRDFSSSRTQSITILPYSKPSFSNPKLYRMDDNNVVGIGTRAKLTATIYYQYWSGLSGSATNNDVDKNTIQFKYKQEGGSWSSWITINPNKITKNNGTITININDGIRNGSSDDSSIINFTQSVRYEFVLRVSDKLENNIESSSFILDTADVLIWKDLGNKRVGINKKPDSPYSLDVDGNLRVTNSINNTFVSYVGSTNSYPYHRIAYTPVVTTSWGDYSLILLLERGYNGGAFGIVKCDLRTNNTSNGDLATASAYWLARRNFSVDAIVLGLKNTSGSSYLDVYLKHDGTYSSTIITPLFIGNRSSFSSGCYTLLDPRESDGNVAVREVYSSITTQTTSPRQYTTIINAADGGTVNYANSAGSASSASSCSGNAANVTQKKSLSSKSHSNYGTNNGYVPDMSFIAYWNGAYDGNNNSNLTYSANGQIIGSNHFPVGSVVIRGSNSAPNLPGTWTLIDKELTPQYVYSTDTTYFTRSSSSANSLRLDIAGHTITIDAQITCNAKLQDSDVTLGTFKLDNFTTTFSGSNTHARFITAFTDGGNCVVMCEVSGAGVLKSVDVIPDSYVSSGSVIAFQLVLNIPSYTELVDSACNKFYFKRTA